jgi:hypothetical protein
VLVDEGEADALAPLLEREGFAHPRVAPIEPSLEDVFVTLTKGQGAAAATP